MITNERTQEPAHILPRSEFGDAVGPDVRRLEDVLLPGVPIDAVRAAFDHGRGHELRAKFWSARSSSRLVANAFGWFLERPALLPAMHRALETGWHPSTVVLEGTLRFPWSGGEHPHPDIMVRSDDRLVVVEAKLFEPFDAHAWRRDSDAYLRPIWGDRMRGYERIRDMMRERPSHFRHLGASQLFKHAFAARTDARRQGCGKATLLYLHAEPQRRPDGTAVTAEARERHRREIEEFAATTADDEVEFLATTWREMLDRWKASSSHDSGAHVEAVLERHGAWL